MKKLLILILFIPTFAMAQTNIATLPIFIGNLDSAKVLGSINGLTKNFWGIDLVKSRVKYTDTAAMFAGYPRINRFTDSIALMRALANSKISLAQANGLYTPLSQNALKLNITDTANKIPRIIPGANTFVTGDYPNVIISTSGGGGGGGSQNLNQTTALGNTTDTSIVFNAKPLSGTYGNGVFSPSPARLIWKAADTKKANSGIWFDELTLADRQGDTTNSIISMGYNWDGSKASEAMIRIGMESHYRPFSASADAWMEYHLEVQTKNGFRYRPMTWEGSRINPEGHFGFTAGNVRFASPINTYAYNFADIAIGDGLAQFSIGGQTSNIAFLYMQTLVRRSTNSVEISAIGDDVANASYKVGSFNQYNLGTNFQVNNGASTVLNKRLQLDNGAEFIMNGTGGAKVVFNFPTPAFYPDYYFVTSNASSGTFGFYVMNSASAELFTVKNNGQVGFALLPTHASEAAALAAGLLSGSVYKTSTGELRIKL